MDLDRTCGETNNDDRFGKRHGEVHKKDTTEMFEMLFDDAAPKMQGLCSSQGVATPKK